jgi:hypothetical protein
MDQGSLVELFRQRGYTVNRVTYANASILQHQSVSSQQHVGDEHNDEKMAKGNNNHHRHLYLFVLLANLIFGILILFGLFICTKRLQNTNNNAADGADAVAENGGGEDGKLCHLQSPISMRNLEEQIASDQQEEEQKEAATVADENPYEIV